MKFKRLLYMVSAGVFFFLLIFNVCLYCSLRPYAIIEKNYFGYEESFHKDHGFYLVRSTSDSLLKRTFDKDGILQLEIGEIVSKEYHPVYISQFVLALGRYERDPKIKIIIVRHLDFLLDKYAEKTASGTFLYPYRYDLPSEKLKADWYSVMAQAQTCSALLYGYRMTGNRKYFEGAKKSLFAILTENKKCGFFTQLKNGVWLNDFPQSKRVVFDGSIFGIAGVYDLYKSLGKYDREKVEVKKLYDSILGLKTKYREFRRPFGGVYYDNQYNVAGQTYYLSVIKLLDYLKDYDSSLQSVLEDCKMPKSVFFRTLNYMVEYYREMLGITKFQLE